MLMCMNYSWSPLIQTRLFLIPRYFELKTISLRFAPQSFTISAIFNSVYYELFFVSPQRSYPII